MKTHFAMIMALGLLGSVGYAKPACNNMKITLVPTNYSSGTTQMVTFNARVQADTSDGGCNYFITISNGSSSTYNTRSVKYGSYSWPYQIAKDAGGLQIIKSFPEGSSCSDFLCSSLPSGNNHATKDNNYQFILDASNEWRKHGSYSDNYTLRVYKGTPGSYTLEDQAGMNVTFMASKKADIALVDSGASFDVSDTTQIMNFGAMAAGSQRMADLILKYNAGCRLYASSMNNGSMKHLLQNQFIPYTMTIDGQTVNLSNSSGNPKLVNTNSGVSPASGDINPLKVVIGNVNGRSPGLYYDLITFTVQSTE